MDEQSLKDTVAKNLIYYRKMAHLTQLELAEKLNYSDKSISKWERAEGLPDVYILCQLATLYGVTLNDIVSDAPKKKPVNLKTHRMYISLLSAGLVWLVAVVGFVLLLILLPSYHRAWITFIYAVPISAIVLLVLTSAWGTRLLCCIFISILIWGLATAVYLSFTFAMAWLIFIVAIPLQILTILWFFFKKYKNKKVV